MTYRGQLSAAKFRAERDQARQELERERHRRKLAESAAAKRDTVRAEDHEAAEWVRDHGGLAHVVDIVHDFRAVVERIGVEWSESELHIIMDVLDSRLMPEGMEWPRYEDGETFIPGDDRSVEFFVDGIFSVWINDDHQHLGPGERVKRPQVLAADGEPLERGLDAWWICEGDDRGIHAERLRVERIGEDGLVECSPYSGGTWVELDPGELYAERPVPDADGVPIKAGYVLHHISGLGNGVTVRQVMPPGCFEDTEFERHIAAEYTHTKPERDSWERIEDDATKQPYSYCVERGLDDDALPTNEKFARDLVRRCKALAERGE